MSVMSLLEAAAKFEAIGEDGMVASALGVAETQGAGARMCTAVAERNPSYFGELRAGLSWREGSLVAMLWGYFDESGYHDRKTNHLKRLSFGGCLASLEAWEGFETEWQTILTQEGIEGAFHMADFEKWVKPFDFKLADGSRDYEKHKRLLNGLLEVIGRRSPRAFGFTRNVSISKPSKALKDTYENCIVDTIMHLANASAYSLNDKVSIIFARHREFSLERIEKYFGFMNYGDARLGTVGTDTPENLCQLQAADIIAYEVSRLERDDGSLRRYPLRKLNQLGCNFRFSTGYP
jgi:hypothetical protein